MINKDTLENYVRVIAYDDDNHGVRIYVNGIYIDNMDNGLDAALHLIIAGQDTCRANTIVTADIYLPEIEDEKIGYKLYKILGTSKKLTEEQEIAILNKDYKSL